MTDTKPVKPAKAAKTAKAAKARKPAAATPPIDRLKRLRPVLSGLVVLVIAVDLTVRLPAAVVWGVIGAAVTVELLPGRSRRLPRSERAAGVPETPEAVEVEPPVTGRWSALNSPADKVPSHGVRSCGQAYAIDVLREEDGSGGAARPAFGWWPPVRGNAAFPAFGAPVLAVAEAEVLRVRDGRRDHGSRNSWPALPVFFAEAMVRDVAGPGRLLGNHVILDLGQGVYALYAHLRRGSAAVREGQRVAPGQVLAEVGNTGNSTEPHLHFQLMDRPDPAVARGIPFHWRGVGVPAAGEVFTAPGGDGTGTGRPGPAG
ncbi:M23 family metallopeptidase [Streptomyces zingiberis]|uniref:M23 family metallopeptidase n=1 Tax=Streptomyces zingiberis TaxID=2053010 RepID=A0ABX1C0X3_9ACTN|nr:M23 family metallopeptidase [Streptomyces zingiberis]NJQ03569.1 M23 family metallopeptidase [Streptomyces zingiberis]